MGLWVILDPRATSLADGPSVGATDQKYITDSITAIKQVGYSVVR